MGKQTLAFDASPLLGVYAASLGSVMLRRLLEAVRHGVLTAAYKTEACHGNGANGCVKADRATCWRYHTEGERHERLVPKQHLCSLIKVSVCPPCVPTC